MLASRIEAHISLNHSHPDMREQEDTRVPDRSRGTRWWRRAWIVPTFLALLPVPIFLRVALLRRVFYAWDVQDYFYPYHALPAAMLKRGELPLWNPYAFSGMPLFGDGQTALLYPPNWLFFVVPGGVALSYSILLQFSIAGVGMYLLSRRLGLWRLPALLGAVAYMFSGVVAARVVHLSILGGAALLPLVVLCVESALRGWVRIASAPRAGHISRGTDAHDTLISAAPSGEPSRQARWRWFVAAAAAIGAQVLTGHPQVPVYTALALALYGCIEGVACWWRTGLWRSFYRPPLLVVGMFTLGYGLAAVQLVPWMELSAASVRAAGASFDFVFSGSRTGGDWLLHLFPYLYGSPQAGLYATRPGLISLAFGTWEQAAYIGTLPLGLAAFALFGRRRPLLGRPSRLPAHTLVFFGLVLLGGLVLAAGSNTPLARALYPMPIIGKLRVAARALVLVDFAVAVLAAVGLQRLTEERTPNTGGRRWSLVVIAAIIVAIPCAAVLAPRAWLQHVLHLPHWAAGNLDPHRLNAAAPLVSAFASAALLTWWSRRRATRRTQALAVALVLLDVGGFAATFTPTASPQFFEKRPSSLAALSDESGPFRKATFVPGNDVVDYVSMEALAASWGMLYGVEDVNGFNSLQTRRYTDYLFGPDTADVSYGQLHDEGLFRPENPILNSLNVRYLFVPAGTNPKVGAGFHQVYANAQVRIYKNSLAYPRAFFAESVRGVTDASEVRRAVTADGFDGRRLALVESEKAPALPVPAGGDRVTVTARAANRISLASETATPRFLVLSEMYAPGWHAKVDGADTAIFRTNYLFRGVVVPAGRHTVIFVYRPLSILIGAGVSALALAAAALLLLAGRRRRLRSASTPPGAGS